MTALLTTSGSDVVGAPLVLRIARRLRLGGAEHMTAWFTTPGSVVVGVPLVLVLLRRSRLRLRFGEPST